MALKVGDKAPDFKLVSFTPSADPKDISLSDYNGKNFVILFFPMSFTGVCTDEMCEMGGDTYKELNAEIMGISTDGTFVQKAFAKQNNIPFPLLSDYNKKAIRAYDVVQPEFAHGQLETSQRAVYVIDKEGIIRYVEVTENPGVQVNFKMLKEAVNSLK